MACHDFFFSRGVQEFVTGDRCIVHVNFFFFRSDIYLPCTPPPKRQSTSAMVYQDAAVSTLSGSFVNQPYCSTTQVKKSCHSASHHAVTSALSAALMHECSRLHMMSCFQPRSVISLLPTIVW